MKLAAKWHGSSSTFFSCPEEGRRMQVKLGGEPADVIRMGKGDPLFLFPAWRAVGNFSCPWPAGWRMTSR